MFKHTPASLKGNIPNRRAKTKAYMLETAHVPKFPNRWFTTDGRPHGIFGFKSLKESWDPEVRRPSFWASDFQHRYRVKSGNDYAGPLPQSPAPGTYQEFTDKQVDRWLGARYRPPRDSRALPVAALTARAVGEDHDEAVASFSMKHKDARQKVGELRDTEYYEWYTKLQRVRGKWCRENGVSSRGVYSPSVDAAEIWS